MTLIRYSASRAVLLWSALLGVLTPGCGGDSGTPVATVKIPVPAPTVNIAVTPSSIPAGQSATLTWSSTGASTCSASGAWMGPEPTSGSLAVSPSAPATYTYTLSCASGSSAPTTESATITVTLPPLAIAGTLSNGVIGTPFSESLQATGGVAPYTWIVSNGALPHNLSLGPSTTDSVTISGTPDTVAQGVAFTIQVTDSSQQSSSQPFTLSILLQADSLALAPGKLDFGNQIVGSASGTLTETLTNTASSEMAISGIAITASQAGNAGEFTQSSTTCASTLAAGASCAINLAFTPGQPGPRGAVLTISDDTAGSPQSVSLGGVGLSNGPNATLSAFSMPFGTELVGTTSPPRRLSLSNYGTAALDVSSISATAGFAEADNCIPTLASAATCTISATFTPTGSGDVTGTLSISDDAAGAPQRVTLSGTGSTNTPLLDGYCLTMCGLVGDTAHCPVGEPARHPVREIGGPMCGGPGGSWIVDTATSCGVPSRHGLSGVCTASY